MCNPRRTQITEKPELLKRKKVNKSLFAGEGVPYLKIKIYIF